MMSILVTGGSGFIGTAMVSSLVKLGREVEIFDQAPSTTHPDLVNLGDIRSPEQIAAAVARSDVIFHLAAAHRDDVRPVSLYHDVNVHGAENVVAAAKRSGCKRIIFTSSVAVYPLNANCPAESSVPSPFNHYGESKLAAEQVFRKWVQEDADASVTVVRPCVVFGERNRGNVYNLLSQVASGRFLMIGSGRNRKSLAYVGNIVPFLISLMEMGPGFHLFNYADKPDLTAGEIVRVAREEMGKNGAAMPRISIPYAAALPLGYLADLAARIARRKLPISSIRVRKFCANTSVAADQIRKSGFVPLFTLEEALRRTIQFEFGKRPACAGGVGVAEKVPSDR